MKIYTLVTGNRGYLDYADGHPFQGPGWKTQATFDEDGSVGELYVKVVSPAGADLGMAKIALKTTAVAIADMIDRDLRGLTPQSERVHYQATTGHERAAQILSLYQAEEWELRTRYFGGMAEDRIQIVQGRVVIANVEVLPLESLVARITDTVHRHHAGEFASDEQRPTPLICVRQIPSGTVLVTLWMSGKEFKETQPGLGADEAVGIDRSMEAYRQLKELVSDWQAKYGAKVDSEIPLDETDEVAAGAEPAKRVPEEAARAARAERQLGRSTQEEQEDSQAPGASEEFRHIPVGEILHFPGGNQRMSFDQQKLEELAESIKALGIIQPLTVNELDGKYTLIAGERRYRAAGMAGQPTVPCRVLHLSEEQALEAMLVENIQREDLNPMEEAKAYKRLLAFPFATQVSVAKRVGKSQQHVNEYLQLTELPADLQRLVAARDLPVQAGLTFLRRTRNLPDIVREQVARVVAERKPTIREAAAVIDQALDDLGTARAVPPKKQESAPASASAQTVPAAPPETQTPPAAPQRQPAPPEPSQVHEQPVSAGTSDDAEPPVLQSSGASSDERAQALRETGAQAWGADLADFEVTLDVEAYAPVPAILANWRTRASLGIQYIPRAMGTIEIHLPQQAVWIRGRDVAAVKAPGQYAASELPIVVQEGRLTVQCVGGRVEGWYGGNPVYYRGALLTARGGGRRVLRQQIVIQEGGRHIVVTGTDSVNIQPEKMPEFELVLNQLPRIPA